MSDLVLTTVDSGVARLTLNRPDARNATSIAMLDAMDAGLDAIAGDDSVRVLRLAGAGRSFCSGLDLGEVRAGDETIRRLLRRLSEVMRRLRRLPLVTIAEVQGAAIGGGFGFMAVTDFAVSHAEAKIGYPPIETGLSPALMAPWLIRKVGPSRARSMLLAGGTISGTRAEALGLVTHLVSREAIADAARTLAAELARGGAEGMRAMKALLNDLDGSTEDDPLDRAALVSAEVIACDETQQRLGELFAGS
jgi:enoyl-CoA hydratase/carnithine racemase